MSDFEKLVPELDLCKQIPKGAFADSALVWSYSCDKRKTEPFVEERDCIDFCRRDMVNAPPVYPAPTLQEIMVALVLLCNEPVCFWMGGWHVKADLPYGELENYDMTSPVTAALKLWLRLNKSDLSDKSDIAESQVPGDAAGGKRKYRPRGERSRKEQYRAAARSYRLRHPEQCREYQRLYRLRKKEMQ